MKGSTFWLPVTFTVLAFISASAVAAQKRLPSSELAQQWLDSLTAEASSGTATVPVSLTGEGLRVRGQGGLQSAAPSKLSEWSNLKNQVSRVAAVASHAAQAAHYLPPAANRWLATNAPNLQTASAASWPTMSAQEGYTGPQPELSFATTSGYSSPARATPVAATSSVAFQRIQSGVVSLDLPADWQAMPALGENMSFVSPRGESFNLGKVDVFCDQASMRNAAQFTGANGIAVAYMQRMVARVMSPEQIVTRLLPQISGGAMQNVIIRGSQRMPYGDTAVAYDYVLLPQADALSRSGLPPALQRAGQVRMRGEIRITLLQGIPVGVVRTWGFMYSGVSAPQPVFSAYGPVYARMFESLQINDAAAQQIMAAQQQTVNSAISAMKSNEQQMQDFTRTYRKNSEQQIGQIQDYNRKRGDIWIDMAGQQTRVKNPNDPNYSGYVQWGSQPSNSRPVHCWAVSNDPVFVDNTKATPNGCSDLQQY